MKFYIIMPARVIKVSFECKMRKIQIAIVPCIVLYYNANDQWAGLTAGGANDCQVSSLKKQL